MKPHGTYTVLEVARRLKRSPEQVRRYLREGKLHGQKFGNQWLINARALESFSNGASAKQLRLQALRGLEKLRKRIFARTGQLFDPAEIIREMREERAKELESRE